MIEKLANYKKIEEHPEFSVCEQDNIVTYIHTGIDFNKDIKDWVKTLCVKQNNIYTKYYRLYSHCYYPDLHTSEFPNFNYIYKPELLFLNPQTTIDFKSIPNLREVKIDKLFCFLNNRSTRYRKELFEFFRDNQLLDISYASYNNVTHKPTYVKLESTEHNIEKSYKNFTEDEKVYHVSRVWNFYPVQDFLFDVCVESYIEDFIGLTEKSIKPFLWGHIPLIYGPANTYRYLKDLGFDVFDNIIDTGFDNERNHVLRMWRFKQEILRLSKIPLKEWDIIQLESRLHNNRNTYLKNISRSLKALDLIEKETNFIINNREEYLGF